MSDSKKYRKKPVVIEATQWFKEGDHPEVEGPKPRHRTPNEIDMCSKCETPLDSHGWIDTLESGHVVCPGDYIITGVQGEHYPCKPDIFDETYERPKMNKTTYILDCSTEHSGVILFDGEVQTQLAILRRLNELESENWQLKGKFNRLADHVREVSDKL